MKQSWDQATLAQEQWVVMKSTLCENAKSILGQACKREADWFRENKDELRPMFEEIGRLYTLWLSTRRQ